MGKGIAFGIIALVAVIVIILGYTNTVEVLKPDIETTVDTAKEAISKVNANDVAEKAEGVSNKIKDVTEKIKITNPLNPEK